MSKGNSNTNSQYLSDLLDEKYTDEAIEQLLEGDESQAKAWYRYNTVRSVLNKEQSAYASFEFTQSISAQIAEEPVFSSLTETVTPSNVVSFFPKWKRTAGGLAMAATVAFAMIFNVQMMNNVAEDDGISTDMASQSQQVLSPVESTLSAFDFKAEQAEQRELDDIQRMLSRLNKRGLNVTEELVGGEFMVQSFVVKAKEPVTPFEEKIRQMKKPSESSSDN